MKRLLFIDDEKAVLNGLRRSLRSHRKEWEMHFASDGATAVKMVELEGPFDVVVTDMRMPEMDGAEVLRKIKKISPRTIRFVLSGQADLDMAMRVATTAHQYFTKPLDSQALQTAISNSMQLHEIILSSTMRGVIGSLSSLPVLPRAYRELQDALSAEEVSLDQVSEIVTSDSALTAKVLQLVNSSYFGLTREITSLRESVNYIGLTNLKTLVLSYGLVEQFESCKAAKEFHAETEQERALQVGALAKSMHGSNRRLGDQAFLAGILHRVGRLVMATNFADSFDAVEVQSRRLESQRLKLETELVGATHCEIGAYLLGSWGLPHDILQSALFYREPQQCTGSDSLTVAGSVGLASYLLHPEEGCGASYSLDDLFPEGSALRQHLDEWQAEAESLLSGC